MINRIDLYQRDFNSLREGMWLTDAIIDGYLEIVKNRIQITNLPKACNVYN